MGLMWREEVEEMEVMTGSKGMTKDVRKERRATAGHRMTGVG